MEGPTGLKIVDFAARASCWPPVCAPLFPPDQAAALLDQARLQRRAADKFNEPARLLFEEEALQQASSRAVAAYRAGQFAVALGTAERPALVADLGCGIGADTIAMAEAGLHVLAVERDPVRARIAAHNVAALGLGERVEVVEGDWTSLSLTPPLSLWERGPESPSDTFSRRESVPVPESLSDTFSQRESVPVPTSLSDTFSRREIVPVPESPSDPLSLRERDGVRVSAAFVDPSRRTGDRRIFAPEAMDPPLSAILPLTELLEAVAVKTMPGIADSDIPPTAEVEFISERGHMKEALLRFGSLRTGAVRRATLLPGPHHLDSQAPLTNTPASELSAYLLEPDPAIIRATLVQHLATALSAADRCLHCVSDC
ncbi:MAG: class I SAM-dependent methyltransferase [Caldilineales bacterium]